MRHTICCCPLNLNEISSSQCQIYTAIRLLRNSIISRDIIPIILDLGGRQLNTLTNLRVKQL